MSCRLGVRPRAHRHGTGLCQHTARVFGGAGCHSPALPALHVPGHGSWVLAAAQGRNLQRPSSPSAERSGETPRHSQKCSEHSQKCSGYWRLKPEVPGERSPRWRVSCSRLVALVTRLPSAASRWGWHPRAGWVQHHCSRGTWKPPRQPSACAGCRGCKARHRDTLRSGCRCVCPRQGLSPPNPALLDLQILLRYIWSSLLAQGGCWLLSAPRQWGRGALGLTSGAGCPWGPGAANVTADTHEPHSLALRGEILTAGPDELLFYYPRS